MNNGIDKPKSLCNSMAIQSRLAGIAKPHILPLTNFVQTIRKETGLEDPSNWSAFPNVDNV
jgi:hypothetical protein